MFGKGVSFFFCFIVKVTCLGMAGFCIVEAVDDTRFFIREFQVAKIWRYSDSKAVVGLCSMDSLKTKLFPTGSMYGIVIYIWLIFL